MDGWEIAFLVLVGLLIAVAAIAVAYGVKDKLGDVTKPFGAYVTTWFSLFPYVFVLAGPIIDVITNQYMYTKASLVGILTVALVGLVFGSNWYASMSKTVVGWLPSIKDTYGGWNYMGLAVWAMVLLFGLGAPAISFIRGTTTGSLVTGLIGGVLLTIVLAGQDWLGGTSFTRTGWYPSTSFAGVTISDVCTTPGLGCVQTSFAPAGILLSSSILASHLFESIDTGNSGQTTALGATLATSFVIEFLTLYSKGCRIEYKYGLFSPFISLALGLGSGAAAYYSMKRLGQGTESFGEGGIFHPPVAPTSKTQTGKKDSSVPTSGEAEQCSSGVMDEYEDGDIALVGELFKDGVPITSDVTVA